MKYLIACAVLIFSTSAGAATIEDLQNEIIRLQKKVIELQKPVEGILSLYFKEQSDCDVFKRSFADVRLLKSSPYRGSTKNIGRRVYATAPDCHFWTTGSYEFAVEVLVK